VAEKWAQKCAKLEKGASGFIFEATQEYAAKIAGGWSYESIAAEVTAAGFPIHKDTVRRRVKALEDVEGSEADFARAYADINIAAKGGTQAPGGIPKNHQGRLLVLQDVVKALVKDNDEDPEDLAELIAGEARAAQRATRPAKAEPEVKRVRVDENYELFIQALELVREAVPPFSKRARTKLEELSLEVQVALSEEATV
jgi:hypothetical protein